MKVLSNSVLLKTLTVSNIEPASEVVRRALESAEMGDAQDYKLLFSNGEDTPSSLIGHEYPFAIKMSQRQKSSEKQGKAEVPAFDLERKPSKVSQIPQCQFQLKYCPVDSHGNSKHCKKNRTKMAWPFRRNSTQTESVSSQEECLFNRHLQDISEGDGTLPKPILDMLTVLFKKGPSSIGIFRKCANMKACKELTAKLNMGREVNLEEEPVVQLTAVFKDFLRRIPNCILRADLYDSWMAAMEKKDVNERTEAIKQVLSKLPSHNLALLRYFFCLLYYINKHSEVNKMDAYNLAICISPNMLWPNKDIALEAQQEVSAKIVTLMQFLIENCCQIFGNITMLLGEPCQVASDYNDHSDVSLSHQNDSAYDSTDQEEWRDTQNEKRRRANNSCSELSASDQARGMEHNQIYRMRNDQETGGCTMTLSSTESIDMTNRVLPQMSPTVCPSAVIIEQYSGRMNRRCSEPILPTNNSSKKISQKELAARSHDDCSITPHDLDFQNPSMKKQTSEESFPKYQFKGRKSFIYNVSSHSELSTASSSKASSVSSLASSCSNLSESSVFANSPLVSPTCPRHEESFSEHHIKRLTSLTQEPDSNAKFAIEKTKKPLKKTLSCPTRSFQGNRDCCKEISLKENQSTCETVHEDAVNESGNSKFSYHSSPDVVFQRVDSQKRGFPPSYNEALIHNTPPILAMKGMTVKHMRSWSQKEQNIEEGTPYSLIQNKHNMRCRSVSGHKTCSLTDDPFKISCQNIKSSSDCYNTQTAENHANHFTICEKPHQYRGRALSESISRDKNFQLGGCFNQTFNRYPYPKESYV
ncbi:T-cell activation Rho GTPase-activating protein [Callorhinchus milii]|uniref:T-cell activation Rho GTPase-activating protein n=1 Tax=Callorhinchus milii TaxID=7868 RepID=UPI001C3FB900|nr:T-cell activation Rho GTPase-activating protein [Callorhinchus milii]